MPENRVYLEQVGVTIQVLRLMRDLSQVELAERAGIRPNQVSRYETGQDLPQLAQLAKILDALDLDFGEFVFAMRVLLHLGRRIDQGSKTLLAEAILDEMGRSCALRLERIAEAARELSERGRTPCRIPSRLPSATTTKFRIDHDIDEN